MQPTFTIHKTTSHGRLGTISTMHGDFHTPGFFFCATSAALRLLTTDQAKQLHTQGILCNTYHLMDQADTIAHFGGLHTFLNWNQPIMSDSGGFQIFSLGHGTVADEIKRRQSNKQSFIHSLNQDSVTFRNIKNGSLQTLTPYKAIQIQRKLGSDLIFVLDECTPFNVSKEYVHKSLQLTKRWAELCLEEFTLAPTHQGLYGIVQGSVYPDLRLESIAHLNSLPFFGYGIGGSLGAHRNDMIDVLSVCANQLVPTRPVHLLGIGKIQDIITCVPFGIDTFDCVHPTRIARHGSALAPRHLWECVNGQWREHIVLSNAKHRLDQTPIDSNCSCSTCLNYSKGYIHHLLMKKEPLYIHLLSVHNVFFMNKFMEELRAALRCNTWKAFEDAWKV